MTEDAFDQGRVEGDGLDVPDPRAFHRAFLFKGEALARFLGFAIHRGQHSGIQDRRSME